jgi:hypothetical protein
MSETESNIKNKMQQKFVRWGIFAAVLLIVFLIGLVPMWIQKRAVQNELATSQKQLRKSEISSLLTTAIVEANRGEYEPARRNTSDFFTRLQSEVDKGEESALTKEERDKLTAIFTNRDTIITMLAQRDQASVQRLTDIFVIYQKAVGQTLTPEPVAAPTTATNSNQ